MHEPGQKIVQEIKLRGAIPFSRFMELALYCPEYGYYEAEGDNLGRRGDFFTSVSVGPLFGEMLAFQFQRWLSDWAESCPGAAKIAEAGAHDGTLARDILAALRRDQPGLFESVEYWIVEPSDRRRQWQKNKLEGFRSKVRWAKDLKELSTHDSGGYSGVIFANELLDAMPVSRCGWDAKRKQWFEWGVTLDKDYFVWVRLPGGVRLLSGQGRGESDEAFPGPNSPGPGRLGEATPPCLGEATLPKVPDPFMPLLPPALLEVLPDGFTTEMSPAAVDWWSRAARILRHGALLTLDYGLTTEEFFHPHRYEGTVRSYRSHRLTPDPLADPGQQDITAHVNFSLIQEAGEQGGLRTEAFLTQSQFLSSILQHLWSANPSGQNWGTTQTRQFRTLTDPAGLGRFKVLVQTRR